MHPNIDLTLYSSSLRLKGQNNKRLVFDPVRRKYVVLTPEEFVRQLLIQYLLQKKVYNINRIAAEKTITYNGRPRRFDLIVYHKDMTPFLLVECKASDQPLNLSVFEQISRYNSSLQVPYLMITNGREIKCCKMNYEDKSYVFLDYIPDYPAD